MALWGCVTLVAVALQLICNTGAMKTLPLYIVVVDIIILFLYFSFLFLFFLSLFYISTFYLPSFSPFFYSFIVFLFFSLFLFLSLLFIYLSFFILSYIVFLIFFLSLIVSSHVLSFTSFYVRRGRIRRCYHPLCTAEARPSYPIHGHTTRYSRRAE